MDPSNPSPQPQSSLPAATRELVEHLHDGVYFVDRERRILLWNTAAEEISGWSRQEVIGRFCQDNILRHVDDDGRLLCHDGCPLLEVLADGRRREHRIYLRHREGYRVPVHVRVAPVRDDSGAIVGAVETFADETGRDTLHERLRELETLALLDPLTGLTNRRGLENQLQARLEELRRFGWPFGILLIDLDDFKEINDTRGHAMGDQMLRMVARTLGAGARGFDTVGRWGGDEFVVVVANVTLDRLLRIGERICHLIERSELPDFPGLSTTCSVGAASARTEEAISDLLARADRLMYRAKDEGGNRVAA